jgi:hypothetical protein
MNTAEALRQLEMMHRALRATDVLLAESQQLLQAPIRYPGPKGLITVDTSPRARETEEERRAAFPK